MKYLSLFSGYGGFELGIQQAYEDIKSRQQESIWQGAERNSCKRQGDISSTRSRRGESDTQERYRMEQWLCIGFSEIDKYATQIYKKHFNHKEYGDIKTINPAELPDFELLVGGFPCQAFSIAGKRAGFEDTRGTLIYDVFRIIKEKHPKLVLLENVKGLLSHDNGRTFKTIITSLAELGYAVEWQVLNAKNFGVPQNRERVFIIGHLGGFGGRQVFPITQNNSEDIILPTITTRITADSNGTYVRKRQTHQTTPGRGLTPINFQHKAGDGMATRSRKKTELCCTLAAKPGQNGAMLIDENPKIRRLTPTECERLMGLPDGWTEGVSDTQRYKLAGNGVCVPVVKAIVERMIM